MSVAAAVEIGAAVLNHAALAGGGRTEIDQTPIGMSAPVETAAALSRVQNRGGGFRGGGALDARRMTRRIEHVEQAFVHRARAVVVSARVDHLAQVDGRSFDAVALPIHDGI